MCLNLESVSSVKDPSYWGHMCLYNNLFSSQTFMLEKKSWEEIHVVLSLQAQFRLFIVLFDCPELRSDWIGSQCGLHISWARNSLRRQSSASNSIAFSFVWIQGGQAYAFLSFWSPSLVVFRLRSAWWYVYPFGFVFKAQSWQMCLMGLQYQVTAAWSPRDSLRPWLLWWGSWNALTSWKD